MKQFYVYEWYDIENGIIFYVGKGCGDRYKQTRVRNKLFLDYYNSHSCDVRIIKYFSDEQEALKYEKKRITELRNKKEAFCNISEGGNGGLHFSWTEEMKNYKSQFNPMKDPQQRIRMSNNNPMKNPEIAKRVASKKSRSVIIGDVEYPSIKDASIAFGTYYETIVNWCKKGINKDGISCRFKDQEQAVFDGKRYNRGGCKSLTYKENHYESPMDLAQELNINVYNIYHWVKRGYDYEGNYCRYDDDTRELVYIPKYAGISKYRSMPVIINGQYYPNKRTAEKELHISSHTINEYLEGKRTDKKYICTYANQQPSQGNTDNSTLEGSTTNG